MSRPLLWIGNNDHPEFQNAWSWADQTGRCHHRKSIGDALRKPARSIAWVIISRTDRIPMPEADFNALLRQHPIAQFATLLGSLCEGEQRTGDSWPMCRRIYWHRWASELVPWCELQINHPEISQRKPGIIGIVSRSSWISAGVVDSLRHMDIPVVAVMPQQLAVAGPYSHLLWDDSVIDNLAAWQRIAVGLPAVCRKAQHHWLVSSPRIETWQALQKSGFSSLHSKPLDIEAIRNTIRFAMR